MLIKCPECNREISDMAISCPHCGYPLKNNASILYKKSIYHFDMKRSIIGLDSPYKRNLFIRNETDDKNYQYGAIMIIDKPTIIKISLGSNSFNSIRETLIPPTDKSKAFYYEISNTFGIMKLRLVGTYDYDPITKKDTKPEVVSDDDLPF